MITKLLIAALLFITTACTTHHSFMDKAVVGYVDGGNQPIVMFPVGVRNGVMLYKPQFTGDCGKVYNSDYQSDNTTTNCYIRAERINGLHSYNQHIGYKAPQGELPSSPMVILTSTNNILTAH